jgi:hypothetical protein
MTKQEAKVRVKTLKEVMEILDAASCYECRDKRSVYWRKLMDLLAEAKRVANGR